MTRRWIAAKLVAGARWAAMRLDGQVLDVHAVRAGTGLFGMPVTVDPCVPRGKVLIRPVGD